MLGFPLLHGNALAALPARALRVAITMALLEEGARVVSVFIPVHDRYGFAFDISRPDNFD